MKRMCFQSCRMLAALTTCALPLVLAACAPNLVQDVANRSVLQDAETLYDFGPERPPLSGVDPDFKGPVVPDGTTPQLWISTATLKPNVPVPKTRIIARIRTSEAYPPLGLRAGYNYVWRNSRDSSVARHWVTMIVPADSSASRHKLQRDARMIEYTHGDPAEPRLVVLQVHSVAIAMCLDDPACQPIAHCGYY